MVVPEVAVVLPAVLLLQAAPVGPVLKAARATAPQEALRVSARTAWDEVRIRTPPVRVPIQRPEILRVRRSAG